MIRRFDKVVPAEPESPGRFQLGPALGAGLLAGIFLLLIPRGSPWAALTFFSPAIMGRAVPPGMMLSLPAAWAIHLGLSLVYGVIVSLFVTTLTQYRAVLVGGMVGFGLYWLNWVVVAAIWPHWIANQIPVLFTHVVFGLVAAGAYRGLLRRRIPVRGGSQ